jgi:short subunit fatty acids transporter
MTKNNYIALILLFVFSIVLVHNVIPHHHHDEISEINNHEHHHHDKKEKYHHNENDEPIGIFSHPTHILASTEFVFSADNSIQKTQTFNQFFLVTDLVIMSVKIPTKRKPPNYISVTPIQLLYSTPTLRGPPALEC